MPMRLPFSFPYFYNNYRYPRNPAPINSNTSISVPANSSAYYNTNINAPTSSSHYFNNVHSNGSNSSINTNMKQKNIKKTENSESNDPESSECFFEIFGLKLHFDDVLIICILFFLYKEEVHDEELFLCLVLLLIS
jgi:hypothetical protein